MRWTGCIACLGENMLVEKPDGKRRPGRTKRKGEDHMKNGF
jgi:hypothetical protein